MSNERGHYGKAVLLAGETPTTVFVERRGLSTVTLILGAIAVGSAVLYARHQSRQIAHLYRTEGQPYQSFAGSLRQDAQELSTRARSAYRGLTARVRPARKAGAVPVIVAPGDQVASAHSVRARAGGR